MAIEVKKGNQDSSVGRRLFAMAAPLAGGALLGPAGAALGGTLGAKVGGASTSDALKAGAVAAASKGMSGGAKAAPEVEVPSGELPGLPSMSEAMPNAFGRRMAMNAANPESTINEGLTVLSSLSPDDPLKQELAPLFIQTQFAKARR